MHSAGAPCTPDPGRSTNAMITYETQNLHPDYKHLALDIGYSRNKATCGIMYDGIGEPIELTFGKVITAVKNWIERNGPCILIVEAVLSTFHNNEGNSDIRGDFEKGRGWYYGPGVVTFAAAMRFLSTLRNIVSIDASVILAEAFLAFKQKRSNHSEDAMIIYNKFWETKPEKLRSGVEPILEDISGVPSVRVFTEQ